VAMVPQAIQNEENAPHERLTKANSFRG
jgi:hypothetical protein